MKITLTRRVAEPCSFGHSPGHEEGRRGAGKYVLIAGDRQSRHTEHDVNSLKRLTISGVVSIVLGLAATGRNSSARLTTRPPSRRQPKPAAACMRLSHGPREF